MSTKRQVIESLREKLRERNADSNYTNQFLYQTLLEQAKWLIRREATAGRIWKSSKLFQPYPVRIIEVSTIDSCLKIKTNCKIYRSAEKLPVLWEDENGPFVKAVSSIDGTTDFFYTNSTTWQSKRKDPYQKNSKTMYSFFEDGYLWIPEHNPHTVELLGFFVDDVTLSKQNCIDCDEKDCVRFLDTPFMAPGWVEAEMMAKSLELLLNTKRIPEDEQINKNPNTKG